MAQLITGGVFMYGRKCRRGNGAVYVAFGIGLFLGCCFPEKYLVIILAAAVILCGLALCR